MKNQLVDPNWLEQNLDNPDIIILDASEESNVFGLEVKHPNQFIPNTRKLDLKLKFSDPTSGLPHTLPSIEKFEQAARELGISNQHELVVYDNLGVYNSPRVWWMFRAMGHENIAVLDGGLNRWIQEGYHTVTETNHDFPIGNFKANWQPDWFKSRADILRHIENEDALIFDARSKGRFTGEAPEPRAGLSSGHMPGATSMPFPEVLDGEQFKSLKELRQIFSSYPQDKPHIFSCGSGLTACILHLANYMVAPGNLSVYDGSWTEWAQHPDCPIVKGE